MCITIGASITELRSDSKSSIRPRDSLKWPLRTRPSILSMLASNDVAVPAWHPRAASSYPSNSNARRPPIEAAQTVTQDQAEDLIHDIAARAGLAKSPRH